MTDEVATNAGNGTVSPSIGRLVASLRAGNLPDQVRRAAIDRIVDTLGVALAGSRADVIARMTRAALVWSPVTTDGATIWGEGLRTSAPTAALVNAASVHSEDFDDTHTAGVVHGSTCVVPAAWAAAELCDADAETVLKAVVAGWEVAARIGLASRGELHRRGWHPTSVAGVFGAATAAAVVFGLTETEVMHALGLAGSGAGGINAYLSNGSSGKLLNPALAAQTGVVAAILAREGVTGPDQVLEGRFGVFEACIGSRPELTDEFRDLGQRWEILRVSTKPYPACHFSHAVIDAIVALRREGLSAKNLETVHCHIPPETFRLIAEPWPAKLEPNSVYGLRFSLPWLVAIALVDGHVTRDSFTEETLRRDDLRAVAQRVTAVRWEDSPYPYSFPGRAEAMTKDGRRLVVEVPINRGHPDNPLSAHELRGKFLHCAAARLSQDSAQRLLDELMTMGERTKIRTLSAHLNSAVSD